MLWHHTCFLICYCASTQVKVESETEWKNSALATIQMKKMFKDIFFGQTLNAETVLEMHYIQRTGSVETDELGN